MRAELGWEPQSSGDVPDHGERALPHGLDPGQSATRSPGTQPHTINVLQRHRYQIYRSPRSKPKGRAGTRMGSGSAP